MSLSIFFNIFLTVLLNARIDQFFEGGNFVTTSLNFSVIKSRPSGLRLILQTLKYKKKYIALNIFDDNNIMSTTSIMSVKEMIERSFGSEEVSTTLNILELLLQLTL